MDEVSSHVRLDMPCDCRQGRPIDCSASSSNPMMEGPWCRFRREARAREQHRHAAVDSLKVLDPKWPIREAAKVLRRRDWSRGARKRPSAILILVEDAIGNFFLGFLP